MKGIKAGIKFLTARDIVVSVVFFILGLVTNWYSGRESAAEAERVNQLILRSIETIGTVIYSRDSSGKIVDIKIKLSGQASGNVTATGTLTDAP